MRQKPTSKLHRLPTSLTIRCTVFIVWRSQCTIREKTAILSFSYAWCNLHWSQSSTRYVQNSRKSQLYIYLGREGQLVMPHWLQNSSRSLHNSRKNSYTLSLQKPAFLFPRIVILYTIPAIHLLSLLKEAFMFLLIYNVRSNCKYDIQFQSNIQSQLL